MIKVNYATTLGLIVSAYLILRFTVFVFFMPVYGPTLLDESLVLVFAPFAFAYAVRSLSTTVAFASFFVVYALIGLISALVSPYGGVPQPLSALYDIVLDAKFVVLALGFAFFLRGPADAARALDIVCCTIIVLALIDLPFVLMDFLSGGNVGLRGQRLWGRLGFYQPSGVMPHHLESTWLALCGAVCALYFLLKKRTVLMVSIAALLALDTYIHLSAKEAVALTLCIAVMFSGRVSNLRTIVFGAPVVVAFLGAAWFLTPLGALVSSQVDNYAARTDAARTILTLRSWDAAVDFFPFGTGAGTFASPPSYTLGYSEIYVKYGLATIWGATREYYGFLVDVFWPKILAQSGFLGLFAYIAFLAGIALRAFRQYVMYTDAISKLVLSMVVAVLVLSIASTPLTQDLIYPLFALSCAFSLSRNRANDADVMRPSQSPRPAFKCAV